MSSVVLYNNRVAQTESAALPESQIFRLSVAELLLSFIYDLGAALQKKPIVCRLKNSNKLQILFENSAILCDDFFTSYQELMASISIRCPLKVLGTTEYRETGELSALASSKEIVLQKSNVSGRNFDTLTSVCIEIQENNTNQIDFLEESINNFNFYYKNIALRKMFEQEAIDCGIFVEACEALFCYLSMEQQTDNEDLLLCLSMAQKKQLWLEFLINKSCPAEFYWLLSAYRKGDNVPLFEWELSLQLALEETHMTIINQPKEFKIIDCNNDILHLDFIHGCAAEKMLLKILFPVKPQEIKQ